MEFLTILGQDVELTVKPAAFRNKGQQGAHVGHDTARSPTPINSGVEDFLFPKLEPRRIDGGVSGCVLNVLCPE